MTVVKFCGFRHKSDVEDAVSVGCDLIGLNFVAASPRSVTVDEARTLVDSHQSKMLFVAVLQNHERDFVDRLLAQVNVSFLQFHGNEDAEFCRSFNVPYIKSFHVDEDFDFRTAIQSYGDAFAYLLDTPSELGGGSGKSFDWSRFPQDAENRILLAGGLDAKNVNAAIKQCQPWGVDVASGIEDEKHRKQKDEMIRFMSAIRYG